MRDVLLLSGRATADVPAYTTTLRSDVESAGVARHLVKGVLGLWALPQLTEDAAQIVSELVSNAAEHADGTSIRVTVTRTSAHQVRLAVVDMDKVQPRTRAAAPSDERGRGLALVEALSDRWGVDPLPWGKRVWACLTAQPPS